MAQEQSTSAVSPYDSMLASAALTALRVMAGLLFMQHGAQKLLGAFGGFGGTPGATAPLLSQMGIAGVIELVGGVMIALGLITRIVSFIASGEMAVAYFMAHHSRSFYPIENNGEHTILFCFVFLLFAAVGAGPYSLDALLFRRRPPAAARAT